MEEFKTQYGIGYAQKLMKRNDFMEAVKNDADYTLRLPCEFDISRLDPIEEHNRGITLYMNNLNGELGYIKLIKAKELYDSIVENAWGDAELMKIFE